MVCVARILKIFIRKMSLHEPRDKRHSRIRIAIAGAVSRAWQALVTSSVTFLSKVYWETAQAEITNEPGSKLGGVKIGLNL